MYAHLSCTNTTALCNSLSYVCEYVSMLVQNRLLNHAYYGHEAFAGDSVG